MLESDMKAAMRWLICDLIERRTLSNPRLFVELVVLSYICGLYGWTDVIDKDVAPIVETMDRDAVDQGFKFGKE